MSDQNEQNFQRFLLRETYSPIFTDLVTSTSAKIATLESVTPVQSDNDAVGESIG